MSEESKPKTEAAVTETQLEEQHEAEPSSKKPGLWKRFKDASYSAGDSFSKSIQPLEDSVNKATANMNHSVENAGKGQGKSSKNKKADDQAADTTATEKKKEETPESPRKDDDTTDKKASN